MKEDPHDNGDGWFGGGLIDVRGHDSYFVKMAVVPLDAPVATGRTACGPVGGG